MELLERLCTLTDHVEYDANIDIKDDNIVVKLKRFETNVACDLAAASATNLPVTEFHPNFLTPLLQTQPVTLLAVRPTQLQRNLFFVNGLYLTPTGMNSLFEFNPSCQFYALPYLSCEKILEEYDNVFLFTNCPKNMLLANVSIQLTAFSPH